MRIISKDNIDFVLPAGFASELTKYNVLLSTAGEQTQPITLPPDPVNMKLIGYSNRTDAYYKPLTDLEVLVSDGLFHRWCNMGIHSADDEDGISCTLYFDSGSFYSLSEGKKLASLPWPVIKSPTYDSQTLDQRVQYLVSLIKTEFYTPSANQIFNVTQVVTTQDYSYRRVRSGLPTATTVHVDSKLVLNGYDPSSSRNGDVLPAISTGGSIVEYKIHRDTGESLLGETIQFVKYGDGEITLPIGYGMTPFLKVKYMLSIIFSGYTLNTSAIQAKYQYFDNEESIINNVADAITSGVIEFSKLVPDTTVKDFISTLEKRYAGKFLINNIHKTVVFIDNEIKISDVDLDLTPYLSTVPKQGATEFSNLLVKYKSDAIATTSDDTDKVTTIEVDFMERKTISFERVFVNQSRSEFYYPILSTYLCDIGDIVHKYTSIVSGGVVKTENGKTSADIQVITVDRWTNSFFYYFEFPPTKFYTAIRYSDDPNDGTNVPMHPDMKAFYAPYANILKNSNIPISAKMNIPTLVLENIDIQKPKLLQGQPVMIESIKQVLGSDSSQDVKLRTLRLFIDR